MRLGRPEFGNNIYFGRIEQQQEEEEEEERVT